MLVEIRRLLWPPPTSRPAFTSFLDLRLNGRQEDYMRNYNRRNNGNEFSKKFDAFHLPYPEDSNEARSPDSEETQSSMNDPILRLPAELSDLIFSFLSTPALEVARCTSRAWRSKITNSRWILASVLRETLSRNTSLRGLLRTLEHQCDPESPSSVEHYGPVWSPEYCQKYDARRIRFRVNTLHLFPASTLQGSQAKSYVPQIAGVHIRRTSSNIFLVVEVVNRTNDSRTSISDTHALFIYRFRPKYSPGYIPYPDQQFEYGGSILIEKLEGPLEVDVTELKPNQAWILHVRNVEMEWSSARQYSLITKTAFSRQDARFVLEPLSTGLETFKKGSASPDLHILGNRPTSVDRWKLVTDVDVQGEVCVKVF